ncbi:hypothetical protein BVRB_6g152380 [Beta vulgaris subsp. vulgaris]|nr:hypothetical protein BVRB_6g152380 [Beta vulgaris subsp. vulgaris]
MRCSFHFSVLLLSYLFYFHSFKTLFIQILNSPSTQSSFFFPLPKLHFS